MSSDLILIPTAVINPQSIVIYNQRISDFKKSKDNSEKQFVCFNPEGEPVLTSTSDTANDAFLNSSRKAEGNVSIQAKRKLNKAISYLTTIAKPKKVYERLSGKTVLFKIAFITLTLPSEQIHSDTEIINKCLNSFLLEAKHFYQIKNYVWRAEKQKNGNIHFHIVLDKFIPWNELRDRWNRIINKLGYVDRYQEAQKEWHRDGFRPRPDKFNTWSEEDQYQSFLRSSKTGFQSPNSTDIHSTKKIKNINSYLSKYMVKNELEDVLIVRKSAKNDQSLTPFEQSRLQKLSNEIKQKYLSMSEEQVNKLKQTGRLWGCNHELSRARGKSIEIDSEISDELNRIAANKRVHRHHDDFYSVFYVDHKHLKDLGADNLFNYFADYLFDTFQHSEQLEFKPPK